MEYQEWINRGIKEGYSFVIIAYDLEDKSYFPVYFSFEYECNRYKDNIISESKIKVIATYNLQSTNF